GRPSSQRCAPRSGTSRCRSPPVCTVPCAPRSPSARGMPAAGSGRAPPTARWRCPSIESCAAACEAPAVRILFLSNFFPPLHLGGYEELPAEVAERLRARQHRVDILTSNWRAPAAGAEPYVHRRLHLEVDMRPGHGTIGFFAGRARRAAANIARLEETVIATRPDVIVVWGM